MLILPLKLWLSEWIFAMLSLLMTIGLQVNLGSPQRVRMSSFKNLATVGNFVVLPCRSLAFHHVSMLHRLGRNRYVWNQCGVEWDFLAALDFDISSHNLSKPAQSKDFNLKSSEAIIFTSWMAATA